MAISFCSALLCRHKKSLTVIVKLFLYKVALAFFLVKLMIHSDHLQWRPHHILIKNLKQFAQVLF